MVESVRSWISTHRYWNVGDAARILAREGCRFSAPAVQVFGFNGTMKRIFSTDHLEPRDRYDCWHEVVCKYIIPHDSVPDCRQSFVARLDAAKLGDLSLVSFEAVPLTCSHETHHIGVLADELIFVRQMSGQMTITQGDRAVTLEPGEMALVEPRQPYRARWDSDIGILVAKFPRRNLIERVGRIDRFLTRTLSADFGQTGLLSDFLRVLPAHAEALGATAPQVSDQLLDLIAAGLWQVGGGEVPRVSSSRALLRMQLRTAIERSVEDHAVTAGSIAKSVGIGLRYANQILRDDDTSVGRLLQARRLDHCRRALADPLKMHRSISEIAYSLGFTDMTHFGRRFRQAFGLLPSDYRKLQRQAPTHRIIGGIIDG
jgi:AraC family transcriptional regulator, positive regulator of tynA and feaB